MSQEFLDRVHAEDWIGLSQMYSEDAVVMQPNQPSLVGRAAIHDFWAAMPPIKKNADWRKDPDPDRCEALLKAAGRS